MGQDSKYKTLVKDTLIFALGSIGSKIIIFFLVPFYTAYLSPAEYGTADLIFTISQLAIPCLSLVIFDGVIRYGLYRKERPQDVLLVGIVVWLTGSILGAVLTPFLAFYRSVAEWKWFVFGYVSVSILLSIELNYLKAINKNLTYSLICILQTALLAGLNILYVAVYRTGIKGYLIAYIGSTALAAVVSFLVGGLYKDLKRSVYSKPLAKEMIAYSAPLVINNLSWWVIQSSDKLMLEAMIGATALGIYTVAARIPSLISVFVTIFQQAWGVSSIKEMDSSNDSSFYSNVFSLFSTLMFGACIAICTITRPFMSIYIRNEAYKEAWMYVPLLLVSAVFSAIAAYCGSIYGALKKSVNNMLTTFIAAVINLIVNYAMILLTGIWGAIIGTVVSYCVLAFVRLWDILRYVPIKIKWGKLIILSMIIVLQALTVSLFDLQIGLIVSIVVIIIFVWTEYKDILTLITSFLRKR
ncbi:MAG: polysaccharide biosynthesis C-terminal domain-containing protein [Lachnospiraceae bacterium]|nr:polysaccharide biosynthesis C-terminal domain-containing protein [Lachnospiraceae bacterium]